MEFNQNILYTYNMLSKHMPADRTEILIYSDQYIKRKTL